MIGHQGWRRNKLNKEIIVYFAPKESGEDYGNVSVFIFAITVTSTSDYGNVSGITWINSFPVHLLWNLDVVAGYYIHLYVYEYLIKPCMHVNANVLLHAGVFTNIGVLAIIMLLL